MQYLNSWSVPLIQATKQVANYQRHTSQDLLGRGQQLNDLHLTFPLQQGVPSLTWLYSPLRRALWLLRSGSNLTGLSIYNLSANAKHRFLEIVKDDFSNLLPDTGRLCNFFQSCFAKCGN